MSKQTELAQLGDTVTVDSSGNVGIGTSSPSAKLHVDGQVISTDSFKLNSNVNTPSGNAMFRPASNTLAFATNSSERIRIDSSGRILCGHTSSISNGGDSQRLQITGTGSSDGISLARFNTDFGAYFTIGRSGSGTIGTYTAVPNNDEIGRIQWAVADGTDMSSVGASISVFTEQTAASNDVPSRLVFSTTADGASSPTERMRIDSSGNLMVGTTSNQFSLTSGGDAGMVYRANASLDVARDDGTVMFINRLTSNGDLVEFRKNGGGVGSIGTDGSSLYIGSFTGSDSFINFESQAITPSNSSGGSRDNAIDLGKSDARFDDIYATNGTIQTSDRNEKQDIEELTEAEKRVAIAAKGLMRKFRWKSAVEEKGEAARTHFGIIAQDLQAAFAAEGLDAGDYAMFISGTWTDEETGEERTRLGVRYSELLAFIIGAL